MMKAFKDLKIGDVICEVGYCLEYEIIKIVTSKYSSITEGIKSDNLTQGYMKLYCEGKIFIVHENFYCENCGTWDIPHIITPKENLEEFKRVYDIALDKGVRVFKHQVKSLFEE